MHAEREEPREEAGEMFEGVARLTVDGICDE